MVLLPTPSWPVLLTVAVDALPRVPPFVILPRPPCLSQLALAGALSRRYCLYFTRTRVARFRADRRNEIPSIAFSCKWPDVVVVVVVRRTAIVASTTCVQGSKYSRIKRFAISPGAGIRESTRGSIPDPAPASPGIHGPARGSPAPANSSVPGASNDSRI